MIPILKADHLNLSDLRSTADIIEEKDELTTYLGFCEPGTVDETEARFSILRITQTSTTAKPATTRFMWANGLCSYNLKWSERHNYDYQFRIF